jgi:hypothetical protein
MPRRQAKAAFGRSGHSATHKPQLAGSVARASQAQAAGQFANGVLPVLEAVQKSGALTLADITDALNARGVRSATGGIWHRSAVRNLLARAQSCED